MPCYDSRDNPRYVREEALREFRHNSPVAELLCEAVNTIVALGGSWANFSPELQQWAVEHRQRDLEKDSKK